MIHWLWLFLALVIGMVIGVFIAALCHVAHDDESIEDWIDEETERACCGHCKAGCND